MCPAKSFEKLTELEASRFFLLTKMSAVSHPIKLMRTGIPRRFVLVTVPTTEG